MALTETNLTFPVPFRKYKGKVRDVYTLGETLMVLVATDRISAFDVILPQAIPFKGQVLNQLASYFLQACKDVCPNHLISTPDPNVTIGLKCELIPIEMVVRGYLAGHAWRVYKSGERTLCGVTLPDGLRENEKLPEPILTPSTKSTIGHDEDISETEILKSGITDEFTWYTMKKYTFDLFRKGTQMAAEKGLILMDTKYEFGLHEEKVYLIDEIHTPDSSRYIYADGYEARLVSGEPQRQLSKEFVREWLMAQEFSGQENQTPPLFPTEFLESITSRYVELYHQVTGLEFKPDPAENIEERIALNVRQALLELGMPEL